MLITVIADMHGNLKFKVPETDLLLIAGDICPASHDRYISIGMQRTWLENKFKKWIYEQPVDHAIAIAGNHCWIWECAESEVPIWFPKNCVDKEMVEDNKIEYIEDFLVFYKDLKIYGTPVQLSFNNWAFNREEESLQKYWDNIPEGLDILLLHSPPYGILDQTHHPKYPSKRIGSKSLLKRIKQVKPKLVVFGHNHGDHGVVEEDGIKYINASLIDEHYKMVRKPIVIEI